MLDYVGIRPYMSLSFTVAAPCIHSTLLTQAEKLERVRETLLSFIRTRKSITISYTVLDRTYLPETGVDHLREIMVKRYVFALDLVDNKKLIAEYEVHHQSVWPEVEQQILAAGILSCQIYRVMNRLCMILDTQDDFSFENKAAMDAHHEYTQSWEELMWKYQKALPCAAPGEKWVLMDQIYQLPRHQQQQQ